MSTEFMQVQNCQAITSVASLRTKHRLETLVMEPKFDGFRLVAHRRRPLIAEDRGVVTWTRALKDQTGKLPYVEEELMNVFPPDTILDGEIIAIAEGADGKLINDFERVQSVMGSKPERAARLGRAAPLTYVVFDCMRWGGEDIRRLPLTVRRALVETQLYDVGAQHVVLTEQFPANDETHVALVEAGFEGSVVKSTLAPYASGKRGKGWYKMKMVWDVDVIVMGFKPGNGAFEDTFGSIIFGQPSAIEGKLIERGSCSGMKMSQREEFADLMNIGDVITVKHMGVNDDGVHFRHPQFKRVRPDRTASDVSWHDS